jgi:hypothetical protein
VHQQAEVREAVGAHVAWRPVEQTTFWRLEVHAERGQGPGISLRVDTERERTSYGV